MCSKPRFAGWGIRSASFVIGISINRHGQEGFEEPEPYLEDGSLFISTIQVAEIADRCRRYDIDGMGAMNIVREFVNVVAVEDLHCIEGARIKNEMRGKGVRKFSLSDGIILAGARALGQKLLTRDDDFRKAEDALVLPGGGDPGRGGRTDGGRTDGGRTGGHRRTRSAR